jgi:hypothetical protein
MYIDENGAKYKKNNRSPLRSCKSHLYPVQADMYFSHAGNSRAILRRHPNDESQTK